MWSLAFLWCFTGITSVFLEPEFGFNLLSQVGVTGVLADFAVYGGGILDFIIGLWLLSFYKLKNCCIFQIAVIAIYTALLTIVDANFWLHPFGPVTKNIPIIVLILFVYKADESKQRPK